MYIKLYPRSALFIPVLAFSLSRRRNRCMCQSESCYTYLPFLLLPPSPPAITKLLFAMLASSAAPSISPSHLISLRPATLSSDPYHANSSSSRLLSCLTRVAVEGHMISVAQDILILAPIPIHSFIVLALARAGSNKSAS